jgi:uracil-DNA glycosylase family 4
MNSEEELYKLAEEIRRCTACPLWKGRTLAVPGEGNSQAKIMFVGEAPGAEEDRQGRPFVGRAGKLLDEMLKVAGLKREEVFITNCVKCRPPGNRNPKTAELKTCKKWLDKQIDIIKPALIVLLGRVAVKNLLGEARIKDHNGKVIEKKNQRYFVTYHPAAAIRFPIKIRGEMEKDFEKLRLIKNEKMSEM